MPHALAETITQSPTESGDALALRADALRAEAWAGEPFVRADEDPDGRPRARHGPPAGTRRRAGRARRRPSGAVGGVEGALCAAARTRAHALGAAAAPRLRHRAAPPPGGRAGRDADRADRRHAEEQNGNGNGHAEEPADEDDEPEDELELAPDGSTTSCRSRSRSSRTPARYGATGSATRRRRARRSRPQASSRRREPKAS